MIEALAAVPTAAAAVVLLAGLRHPRTRFVAHSGLALELLLAAGLMRLGATSSYPALATVATIVLLRRLIARGIRAGASVAAPG